MKVKLVSTTEISQQYLLELAKEHSGDESYTQFLQGIQTGEGLVSYLARVSSPNQSNPDYAKLIKYCLDHKHVSIFEMIDFCFEIETTLAIAPQLLRHKSLVFQQKSFRYSSENVSYDVIKARRQDKKNRQNSIDDLSEDVVNWFSQAQKTVGDLSCQLYQEALDKGIAKELARMILPQNTTTKLYAKGSLRSWIHYCQVRNHPDTQLEHRIIASEIQEVIKQHCPAVAQALEW